MSQFSQNCENGAIGQEGKVFLTEFGPHGLTYKPEQWASCYAAPMIPSNTGSVK